MICFKNLPREKKNDHRGIQRGSYRKEELSLNSETSVYHLTKNLNYAKLYKETKP